MEGTGGNDIGVGLGNYDSTCTEPSPTPTDNVVSHNDISNTAVNNTRGWDGSTGYQAGIEATGDGDVIDHNTISGAGYTSVTLPPHLFCIDDTFTNPETESHNTCP